MKCMKDGCDGEYGFLNGWDYWYCECGEKLSLAAYEKIEAMQKVVEKLPVDINGVRCVPVVDSVVHPITGGIGCISLYKNKLIAVFPGVRMDLGGLMQVQECTIYKKPNCTGPQPCGRSGCKGCEGENDDA